MDKNIVKIVLTFELIMQFWCPSRFRILTIILPTLFYEERQKKTDTLAVLDNYNFCNKHTYTRTWRLYDRPGPEGHVGENIIILPNPQSPLITEKGAEQVKGGLGVIIFFYDVAMKERKIIFTNIDFHAYIKGWITEGCWGI